ncbi:hypothetical protein P9112_000277 [Eukaryota sp. TZLM1-RC]
MKVAWNSSTATNSSKFGGRSSSILAFNSLRPPCAFRQPPPCKDRAVYISKPRSRLEFDSRPLHITLNSPPKVNQRISADDLPPCSEKPDYVISTETTESNKLRQRQLDTIHSKAFVNSSRFFCEHQDSVTCTRTLKWDNFLTSKKFINPNQSEQLKQSKKIDQKLCSSIRLFHDGVIIDSADGSIYSCCGQSKNSKGCRQYKRFGNWNYL